MVNTKNHLTYVLTNGYEKTISFGTEKLLDFVCWFHNESSNNFYEFDEDAGEHTTLFKNLILSVIY